MTSLAVAVVLAPSVVCALLVPAPARAQREVPFSSTHELVRTFRRQHGRLPARLDELCTVLGEESDCERLYPPWFQDRWRRALRLEPAAGDTGYVLRSAGRDGVHGTADDVRSPDESLGWRPLLGTAAGCYAWLPGAEATLGRLARQVPHFRLDTLAGVSAAERGRYELRPRRPTGAGGGRVRQTAAWLPVPPDTVVLTWGDGYTGTGVRLVVRGDTLRGNARRFQDVSQPGQRPEATRGAVAAARAPCPPDGGAPPSQPGV